MKKILRREGRGVKKSEKEEEEKSQRAGYGKERKEVNLNWEKVKNRERVIQSEKKSQID